MDDIFKLAFGKALENTSSREQLLSQRLLQTIYTHQPCSHIGGKLLAKHIVGLSVKHHSVAL